MFPTQDTPEDELKPVVLFPHPGISPGVAGVAGTAGVAGVEEELPPPPPPPPPPLHATIEVGVKVTDAPVPV